MPGHNIIDATRPSDNLIVVVKRIKMEANYEEEINIARYLSQEEFRADARNHCAPMLDVLDPKANY